MEQLKEKVAIIYGASEAIGSTIAHAFAREGATVYVTGKDLNLLNQLTTSIKNDGGV